MTITNGYATLVDFKELKDVTSNDAADDEFIENMITRASRVIDAVCDTWFYSYTGTYYFDVPDGRQILFGIPLLTVTTLTNGDDNTIASTEYNLYPLNHSPKYAIRLTQSTTTMWEEDSSFNTEGVISILGTWGYVDRSATDPESARIIQNTHFACLEICKFWYHQRAGENTGGNTIFTAAGVVQTPAGVIPRSAYEAIKPYIQVV